MKAQEISKTAIARRMGTQLERLLDPDNSPILLKTEQSAVAAVGKRVSIVLVDETRARGCGHE